MNQEISKLCKAAPTTSPKCSQCLRAVNGVVLHPAILVPLILKGTISLGKCSSVKSCIVWHISPKFGRIENVDLLVEVHSYTAFVTAPCTVPPLSATCASVGLWSVIAPPWGEVQGGALESVTGGM